MDCAINNIPTDIEYLKQFQQKAIRNRIPLTGSIDLTYRCNFRCVHCYIGDHLTDNCDSTDELDTEQWLRIIDQFVAAGCLYLLISGGEALLRKDFCEIYTYARKCGLIITVFTNGTTLTDEILATLKEFPPRMVEITLYGASKETYQKITGRRNQMEICLHTVRTLLDNGINTGLKTILMTLNLHEFSMIEDIAKDFDVKFRYDSAIFPRFNGDCSVTRLRVDPETVAAIDFADPDRAKEWNDFYGRMNFDTPDDRLYTCGSGVTNFHITPDGMLQPCLMCKTVTYDLLEGSFAKGWQDTLPEIHKIKNCSDNKCYNCDKKTLCNFCPPFSELESGDNTSGPEYLCRLGNSRFQQLMNMEETNERKKITV